MNDLSKHIAAGLAAAMLLAGLAGCEKREPTAVNKGPAETAGKKIDEASVQANKELNKLMDKAGQQMEKAGEKMQESARKAQTSSEPATGTTSETTKTTSTTGGTGNTGTSSTTTTTTTTDNATGTSR